MLSTAINQNALDQELTGIDRANVLGMLRSFGDLDAGNRYAGSRRAGFPGQADPGSRDPDGLLAPLALAELVQETFWQDRLAFAEQLEQQATMLQPVGGMDRIAAAFETAVQAHIIYEAAVSEIRKTAGGARVVYRDAAGSEQSIAADWCLCTIPATVLRDIPSDFAAGHAQAIADFAYAPAVKVAFQARRFWEQDHNIYGGISWTTQDITQLWYPAQGFGDANGVLLGAYLFGGSAGAAFGAMTPQQRIDATLAQATAVHAQMSGEATRGIGVAWEKVPFQLGAWGVSDPGILREPDDALVLAGEHLSSLQGWQEGAIRSAYRAIDDIVSRDAA